MVSRVIFRHRLLVPKFSCPSRTYISPSLTKERLMTEYQRCRTYTLGKFDKTGLTSKEKLVISPEKRSMNDDDFAKFCKRNSFHQTFFKIIFQT